MRASDLRATEHFTVLLYPFRHAFAGPDRVNRLDHLSGRWLPWWRRFDRADLERALDHTYFFLPFVREQLFPETKCLPASGSAAWAVVVDRLASYALPLSLTDTLDADAVLRLTYAPERLDELRPLKLKYRHENARGTVVEEFETDFDLSWVDAVLFPWGVGLLLLKVRLPSRDLIVGWINDFLYYARAVHPPRPDRTMARWITDPHGSHQRRQERTALELVDLLLDDLADDSQARYESPQRKHPPYSMTPEGQIYGQLFHYYTCVCLAEEPVPPAVTGCDGGVERAEAEGALAFVPDRALGC